MNVDAAQDPSESESYDPGGWSAMTLPMIRRIYEAWLQDRRYDLARQHVELEPLAPSDDLVVRARDFPGVKTGGAGRRELTLKIKDLHASLDVRSGGLESYVRAALDRLVEALVAGRKPQPSARPSR